MGFAPGSGISGRVAKYSRQLRRHLPVDGLFCQRPVFEKLFEMA